VWSSVGAWNRHLVVIHVASCHRSGVVCRPYSSRFTGSQWRRSRTNKHWLGTCVEVCSLIHAVLTPIHAMPPFVIIITKEPKSKARRLKVGWITQWMVQRVSKDVGPLKWGKGTSKFSVPIGETKYTLPTAVLISICRLHFAVHFDLQPQEASNKLVWALGLVRFSFQKANN